MTKSNIAYKSTTVSSSKTQEDIRKLLISFGVRGVQWSEDLQSHVINLRFTKEYKDVMRTVSVSMTVPPPPVSKRPRKRSYRYVRGRIVYDKTLSEKQEQMTKATYRALHDWLKAQFVAVDYGLLTFEDVFLSHFEWTLENGRTTTIGKVVGPHLIEQRPEHLLDLIVDGEISS